MSRTRSGFRDADHFPNRFPFVVEEVQSAELKDHVETVIGERQILRFPTEKMGLALPSAQVAAGLLQHSPGKIEAEEIDLRRQELQIPCCANGNLEHAIAWPEVEFGQESAPQRSQFLAGEKRVDVGLHVVEDRNTVVEFAELAVPAFELPGLDKDRNPVADQKAPARARIQQELAVNLLNEFERLFRQRVAEQRCRFQIHESIRYDKCQAFARALPLPGDSRVISSHWRRNSRTSSMERR